jgi:hypothetical protein
LMISFLAKEEKGWLLTRERYFHLLPSSNIDWKPTPYQIGMAIH